MFLPTRDLNEFNRPVESIMRCEDFKSNFARRLSNRYISRASPIKNQKDITPISHLQDNKSEETDAVKVPERIEPCSQLSMSNKTEQNGETVKPPDKINMKRDDIINAEVSALNMEVETLKWQLAQTESNRQMHLALLKQIVTFLNRIKEHMENQKQVNIPKRERLLPRSFNTADLPRSRSAVHVNKNVEYSLTPVKKISMKNISKSISDVNGFKELIWTNSKLSLNQDTDNSQKITEEISRLITLANTVLSTKIPDLACTCNDIDTEFEIIPRKGNREKSKNTITRETQTKNIFSGTLDLVDEYNNKTSSDSTVELAEYNGLKNNGKSDHPTPLIDSYFNDSYSEISPKPINTCDKNIIANCETFQNIADKKNEYNQGSTFREDESGFSSMSSFQEIGIPIINIIPPTPCKDIAFPDGNILNINDKWPADESNIDKQAVKVFWV